MKKLDIKFQGLDNGLLPTLLNTDITKGFPVGQFVFLKTGIPMSHAHSVSALEVCFDLESSIEFSDPVQMLKDKRDASKNS